MAAESGRLAVVAKLIEQGADVTRAKVSDACRIVLLSLNLFLGFIQGDNGSAPVFLAAQNGHRDVVELLVAKVADVNQCRTSDGTSPLFIACQNGHVHTMATLLEHGADVNKVVKVYLAIHICT